MERCFGFRSFKWLMIVGTHLIDEIDKIAFLCKTKNGSWIIITRFSIDPLWVDPPWNDVEEVGEIEMCYRGVTYYEALAFWWVCTPWGDSLSREKIKE